ncbi:6729_t:CDS:2 [Paraglomus occultum]|uniref:6729_t:CDS:1 n=1 Tax=Paraglomus occultum TaxID=144539 RepID=A0A9N8VRC4_9GLOM|nr:6729_t:CDS:2 [Paraglomus occultum]
MSRRRKQNKSASDDDLSHFDDDAYQSDASTATTATIASTAYQQYSNSRPVRQNLTSHPNSVHFTIPNRPTRVGINQDSQANQSDEAKNEDQADEQNAGETFFLGRKYLLTRKRVVFSAGLILGLIIAWMSMEPTTVNQFSTIFQDLDLSSILPANILVDEIIGNMTMFLKPNILADTEFMPGMQLAEAGISAEFPVVLIPGIVSTGLESWSTATCSQKYFRRRMWGTTTMFRAVLLDKECWTHHMKLDAVTGLDPPDVKLRAAQGKMIQNFAAIGYDSNNMNLAAYDWRLSFYNLEVRDKYFSKLKSTLELAKNSDGKKSVLVSHSMGSMVTLYFFKWVESSLGGNGGPNWVNDHVEAFVNIGGPLLGLPKALSALLSGEMRDTVELGAFGIYVLERFFSRRERAEIFRTWGGLSSMLPKGGEGIWGNTTHAPDDRSYGSRSESYGPMLTFRSVPRNSNNSKSSENKSGPQLVHKHTCNSGVTFLKQNTDKLFNDMLARNYSFGVATQKSEFREAWDHTKWTNPLESTLPYAPDMKIYCLYGWGKETERRYYYSHENDGDENGDCEECATEAVDDDDNEKKHRIKEGLEVLRNIFIDSSINVDTEGLKSGVHNGEGDGTVPLISLGYMCVKGWKDSLYNPAGIKVITREYYHETATFDLRGGSKTADHVDILGNYAVTEDVLKVASGAGDRLTDRFHSNILEYAERVELS